MFAMAWRKGGDRVNGAPHVEMAGVNAIDVLVDEPAKIKGGPRP